jgi:hypothetical protein
LEAIEGTRGEIRRRAIVFESEILTRLGESERRVDQSIASHPSADALGSQIHVVLTRLAALEGRMKRLETQTAEIQQFVTKVRGLRLLRARRKILQRLHR